MSGRKQSSLAAVPEKEMGYSGGASTLSVGLTAFLAACVTLPFFVPTETSAQSGSDLMRVALVFVCVGTAFWFGSVPLIDSSKGKRAEESQPSCWNWIDLLVFGFIVSYTLSCLVGVFGEHAEPRPALNLMWQQLAFGAVYAGVRLLLRTANSQYFFSSIIVSGALVVCGYAWHQYLFELPALHQSYSNASPDQQIQMLLEAGVADPTAGSRMRQLFESRLFNREPFAYFTLANTLAGLMVPIALLTFSLSWQSLVKKQWRPLMVWTFPWLASLTTLVLTSSRTGVLTVSLFMAGIVIWNLLGRESSRKMAWIIAGCVLLLPLLAIGALWAAGVSDGRLISSAPTTLRYRLEYWISSFRMVADHPWLGCGPGSFQSCYAKYQLPTASETVSDPHNFLIEWLATAGVPATIWIGLALIGVVWLLLKRKSVSNLDESQPAFPPGASSAAVWIAVGSLLLAALSGVSSGWLFGFSLNAPMVLWIGLAIASFWLVINLVFTASGVPSATMFRGMFRGLVQGKVQGLDQGVTFAWAGLMLHLSISGGINYPAIGQFFFVFMAIRVNNLRLEGTDDAITVDSKTVDSMNLSLGSSAAKVIAVSLFLLAGYVYYFQLNPLVKSSSLMSRLESSRQVGGGDAILRQVIKADPYNSEAVFQMATEGLFTMLPELSNPEVQRQSEDIIQSALRLEPYSSPARIAVADRYLGLVDLEIASRTPRPVVVDYLMQQADQWLEAASQRKPCDANLLARRSWLKWERGELDQATKLAVAARELDRQMQHSDLKLAMIRFSVTENSMSKLVNLGLEQDSQGKAQVKADLWIRWLLSESDDNRVAPK